jgi:hypothetical protein
VGNHPLRGGDHADHRAVVGLRPGCDNQARCSGLAVLLSPIVGSLVHVLVRPTVNVPQANLLDETWQGARRGVTDIGLDESRQTSN